MEDNAAKRLLLFRNKIEMNQRDFASSLGVSPGLIGNIESERSEPSRSFLLKLSDTYQINADWLLYGRGEMQHAAEPGFTPRFEGAPRIMPPKRNVPGVSDFSIDGHNFGLVRRFDVDASAGRGSVNQSEEVIDQIAFSTNWLHTRGLSADLTGIIIAKGDSMEPLIQNGAQMLVRFNIRAPYPKGIYVFLRDDDTYVKQLEVLETDELDRPKKILMTSANPTAQNELIDVGEATRFRILGEVVTVITDLGK